MSFFWSLLVVGIIIALALFIVLQRRDPAKADEIAASADNWYKKLLNKIRGKIGGEKR